MVYNDENYLITDYIDNDLNYVMIINFEFMNEVLTNILYKGKETDLKKLVGMIGSADWAFLKFGFNIIVNMYAKYSLMRDFTEGDCNIEIYDNGNVFVEHNGEHVSLDKNYGVYDCTLFHMKFTELMNDFGDIKYNKDSMKNVKEELSYKYEKLYKHYHMSNSIIKLRSSLLYFERVFKDEKVIETIQRYIYLERI